MRQGSHSSYVSTSRMDRQTSESGLLEQLMSYDNGLQVLRLQPTLLLPSAEMKRQILGGQHCPKAL